MTFGPLNYSPTASQTASTSSYALPTQATTPQPGETSLSNGSLLKVASIAVLTVLTVLGGGLWLHANLDKRIDRLETRYDTANAEVSRQLVDVKVQLAALTREAEAANERPK